MVHQIKKVERDVDKLYVSHLMGSCREEQRQGRRYKGPACQELKRQGYSL